MAKSSVVPINPSAFKQSQAVPLFASIVGAINNDVAKPTPTFEAGAKRRHLPRTLMGGTEAMRDAREKYLPCHPVESREAYEARVANAFLYNAFEMTVGAQASKFFGEPVVLKDDVPPAIGELCETIDSEGRALTPFCIDLVKEAFVDGISFVLVDFPNMGTGAATMMDQKRAGARPYFVMVRADDVIGWRSKSIAGKEALTQVRIRENIMVPDGDYGEKASQRIRELVPGGWKVWEKQTDTLKGHVKWVVIEDGVTSLDYIPLFPLYVNSVSFFDGAPPLRSLAEMNQEHWISLSEQKRALSFARFDMLVITGVDATGPGLELGPNKVMVLPPGGSASTVTQSGAGIAAGRQDLLDIEARMQTAGLELRVENAGQTTATAAAIDSEESNAGLRAVAKNLEDCIENALQTCAEYLGMPDGGSVEIADTFGGNEIPGTPMEVTALATSGIISKQTAREELKRRNVLSEDFDLEAEQTLLDDEVAANFSMAMEQQTAFAAANPQQQPDNTPPPGGTPAAP